MPTATVCTSEFAGLAQAEARAQGISGLPFILIAHPMASREPAEVRTIAAAVLDGIIAALSASPPP